MTASESPTVGDIFELLSRWRHLPSYPLEGRSAPFFALFLPDVLSAHFNTGIHQTVTPEFPLRIGTLYDEKERQKLRPVPGRNQSYNVDYVAFAKDKSTAYLVELKTDMGSKRRKQDEYLCKARDAEFSVLVRAVKKLARASKSKRKYVHLLHQLSVAGFVSKNDKLDELYKKAFSTSKDVPVWTEAIENLEMGDEICSTTKVVFIQPTKNDANESGFEYIDFEQVANIVQRHGDFGRTFANHLREWTKEAGSPDPRDTHPP